MEQKSQWQKLFEFLQQKKFNIFSPGQKIGKCEEPYIVLKYNGSNQHYLYTTDDDTYTILCYVPKLQYSLLDGYVQSVKLAMKEIFPQFVPTGSFSGSYYEEEIQAHMVSMDFKNHKKR